MTASFEEVRKKFVNNIVRGDYLSNRVGVAPFFYHAAMDENKTTEPRIPRFYETYGTNKEKEPVLVQMLPRWGLNLGEGVKNLETLLAQYPELQKDIDYADYLAEKFELELQEIHKESGGEKREETEEKLNRMMGEYKKRETETGGFYPESDKNYQKFLELKKAEANRPEEGNRK